MSAHVLLNLLNELGKKKDKMRGGRLLGREGWPLGSRLWCLLWVCHFPIGILGQVWYLIVSIPDLCALACFAEHFISFSQRCYGRHNVPENL